MSVYRIAIETPSGYGFDLKFASPEDAVESLRGFMECVEKDGIDLAVKRLTDQLAKKFAEAKQWPDALGGEG